MEAYARTDKYEKYPKLLTLRSGTGSHTIRLFIRVVDGWCWWLKVEKTKQQQQQLLHTAPTGTSKSETLLDNMYAEEKDDESTKEPFFC